LTTHNQQVKKFLKQDFSKKNLLQPVFALAGNTCAIKLSAILTSG
jgi:hypothetical protein